MGNYTFTVDNCTRDDWGGKLPYHERCRQKHIQICALCRHLRRKVTIYVGHKSGVGSVAVRRFKFTESLRKV